MFTITEGVQPTAKKVLIYGSEGIGKSTLASCFPGVLVSDTEGSTKQLSLRRFNRPETWTDLNEQVDAVLNGSASCQTYVVDTVDWAEKLCSQDVCARSHVDGIESIGYGKGYTYMEESFAKFLAKMDQLITKGINVVLIAHAAMRKFEQPDELGAYDRWELKLSKKVAPLCKEWADMILFCNYRTTLSSTKDGKKKAVGDERVMYTTHNACWDAKNRFGLPATLPMEYKSIEHLFGSSQAEASSQAAKPQEQPKPAKAKKAAPAKQEQPQEEVTVTAAAPTPSEAAAAFNPGDVNGLPDNLVSLLIENHVQAFELQAAVTKYYPMGTPFTAWEDGFADFVVQQWPSVFGLIVKNREDLPF